MSRTTEAENDRSIFLVGRDDERRRAGELFEAVPDGPTGLVIHAEPGLGKTTLLAELLGEASARSWTVLSCRPVPPEMDLDYSALADLLEPVGKEVLDQLPDPQRRALDAALFLGRGEAAPPDERALSSAFLSVLNALTRSGPVIVAVDNACNIDAPSARVLHFAARRVRRQPVGIVLCMREPPDTGLALDLRHALPPGRLRVLTLEPLTPADIRQLVLSATGDVLRGPIFRRLLRESAGNPLVAIEMARALQHSPAPLSAAEPLPIPAPARQLAAELMQDVPADARDIVIAASAASSPNMAPPVELLLSVTGHPSWEAAGGPAAEAAEVIQVQAGRVCFPHPLLAAAVHAWAPAPQRRLVHRRLAQAVADPEEQARHLGRAASGPNRAAAEALDAAARRAWDRGAAEAAAELAELALGVSPRSPEQLHRRGLEAAGYLMEAGDHARARSVLDGVLRGARSACVRAEALRRSAIAAQASGGPAAAVPLLDRALEEADGAQEAIVRRDAAWAAVRHGGLARADSDARAAVELARRASDPVIASDASAVLVLIELLSGRRGVELPAEPPLARGSTQRDVPLAFRPGLVVAVIGEWTDDLDGARRHLASEHRWAADRGAVGRLPVLLSRLSELERRAGDWENAWHHADQAVEAALGTDDYVALATALGKRGLVGACLGRVEDARRDLSEGLAAAPASVPATTLNLAGLGFLELSLGDAQTALERLRPVAEVVRSTHPVEPSLLEHLADYIEAAAALGLLDEPRGVLDWFDYRARSLELSSAIAAAERSRALVLAAGGDLEGALAAAERAVEAHARLGMPLGRGRALLVQGRVLRRLKERAAAHRSLDEAANVFAGLKAPLWEAKAAAELARLGLGPRTPGELTPTEARVAELAAAGRSNREIASMTFIAPKTVEANLSRVYAKLGIRSRSELAAALASAKTQRPGSTP